MKAIEFWKLYNSTYKKHIGPDLIVDNHPLSGDCGCYCIALYEDSDGTWCVEKTIERSNHTYRKKYASEEEAVEYVLRKVESVYKV